MTLSDTQRERYARHLSLPEIGEDGQKKLLHSKVLIVGAGGLGSPAALYLAAAGIGTIGLADGDTVDLGNLQRQILHTTDSVGMPKVSSAAERLRALNPDTRLTLHPFHLGKGNAGELVARYDFVVDATDSFETKFLIANVCAKKGIPYSHAGIKGFYGEVMTVRPGKTACYGCVFHEPGAMENAIPEGPLGALPGVIGAIQATETIKYLLSIGRPLFDTVLTFDALGMSIRKITVKRDPHCTLCGD
ncbi:MAG: HesA/MoeB/ThiF family protein [Chlorobi bacterium]|nr:HesA/MoeB/ThiF family protein [Chlorobiota bacterium]